MSFLGTLIGTAIDIVTVPLDIIDGTLPDKLGQLKERLDDGCEELLEADYL